MSDFNTYALPPKGKQTPSRVRMLVSNVPELTEPYIMCRKQQSLVPMW